MKLLLDYAALTWVLGFAVAQSEKLVRLRAMHVPDPVFLLWFPYGKHLLEVDELPLFAKRTEDYLALSHGIHVGNITVVGQAMLSVDNLSLMGVVEKFEPLTDNNVEGPSTKTMLTVQIQAQTADSDAIVKILKSEWDKYLAYLRLDLQGHTSHRASHLSTKEAIRLGSMLLVALLSLLTVVLARCSGRSRRLDAQQQQLNATTHWTERDLDIPNDGDLISAESDDGWMSRVSSIHDAA